MTTGFDSPDNATADAGFGDGPEFDASPITVSASAAKRIAKIVSSEPAGTCLRVTVSGGGCSGFQYSFDLDTTRNDDDVVIERDGATVLIDSISTMYLGGSEIDFVDDLIGAAFQIRNPNATASCGCGTSFAM
jgi:iron-sulfur cluster assembly accessory protein